MIIVISFFVHGVKEMNINRYRVHLQILPTNNATDIYPHSEVVLKHMPKDALKTQRKVNGTNAAEYAAKSAYC